MNDDVTVLLVALISTSLGSTTQILILLAKPERNNMSKQAIASAVRQVVAVAASVYGVLSASISQLHLPPAISAVLTAAGPIVLAVEHYVADPSTGTEPVVQALDASPEIRKLVAEAKTEIARFANDARVYVTAPASAPVPPAVPAAPVAPVVAL